MKAFEEVLEHLDEINIPNEIIPIFTKAMQRMSIYFDKLNGLNLDFDALFKRKLYNNLKFEVVDNIDEGEEVGGLYFPNRNTITLLKKDKYIDFDVHILTHEFIHFIIHNSYKDLPRWADEMMTEYTAMQISNANYGCYLSLMNLASFFNDYVENLSTTQFFNGEFQYFIDKHQLNNIVDDLDNCTKSSYVKSAITKPIIHHFIDIKMNQMLKGDISYNQILETFINMASSQKEIGDNVTLEQLTDITKTYVNNKTYMCINFDRVGLNINQTLEALMMQKFFEYKSNEPIKYIQKFSVGDIENYIAYSQNKIFMLSNAKDSMLSEFVELEEGYSYTYKFSGRGSSFSKTDSSDRFIIINDKKFCYNQSLGKYDIPNAIVYDCKNDKPIKEMNNIINNILYEVNCRRLPHTKDLSHIRINADDPQLLPELQQLNDIIKKSNISVYSTKPTTYTTGSSPESRLVYVSPIYWLSDKAVKEGRQVGFNINKDTLSALSEYMRKGEQVNFFAKKQNGEVFPMINVIKNYKDDSYQISFAYDKLMKELPKTYKDMVYHKFVPQIDYEILLDK